MAGISESDRGNNYRKLPERTHVPPARCHNRHSSRAQRKARQHQQQRSAAYFQLRHASVVAISSTASAAAAAVAALQQQRSTRGSSGCRVAPDDGLERIKPCVDLPESDSWRTYHFVRALPREQHAAAGCRQFDWRQTQRRSKQGRWNGIHSGSAAAFSGGKAPFRFEALRSASGDSSASQSMDERKPFTSGSCLINCKGEAGEAFGSSHAFICLGLG